MFLDRQSTPSRRSRHYLTKRTPFAAPNNNDWCHASDASGVRCALADIPKSLTELADDPFRSLVGELIRGRRLRQEPRTVL
jgi:hypothetical protein